MLYSLALDKLLKDEQKPLTPDLIHEIASNGTKIIETIINNKTYKSKFRKIISLKLPETSFFNSSPQVLPEQR